MALGLQIWGAYTHIEMMNPAHLTNTQVSLPLQIDSEEALVRNLIQSVSRAGICSDPAAVTNFYIALKSKPLAILAGPELSGKIAMVKCLARVLMGGDCLQCQMLKGHPWSAAKGGNVAFFTEIHTRYNSEKLLCLIEEAWRPENVNKVFLACLTRISPAELEEFFTAIAFPLQHGHLMRFGDVHFSEPVPFPPNLFMIGTMDTSFFDWWDSDLLSSTTVIQWNEKPVDNTDCPLTSDRSLPAEKSFLRSCIRKEQAVYRKLHTVIGWQRQPVLPLFLIEPIFDKAGIPLPRTLVNEVMTYLANSWTRRGAGLFHASPKRNLTIALDFAIAQVYLPRAAWWIQESKVLRENLAGQLNGNYPFAAQTLVALAG